MGGVGDVDRLSLSDTRPPHPTPSQVCDALEDIMTRRVPTSWITTDATSSGTLV